MEAKLNIVNGTTLQEGIPRSLGNLTHSHVVNNDLKIAVWLYFLLLVFEGALRKWLLPGLATPLLIIRDPLAFYILCVAWHRGLLPSTTYLSGMLVVGFIGIITGTLWGHGNLWVALFGARIMLLHFPLIFAIGKIFNRNDVVALGKFTVWLSIPLALLVALQFYSPQSAWVNKGVGESITSGFSGAMGYYRPSSTFSFTNGTTLFFGFVAVFVLHFWLQLEAINKLILLAATAALLIAIPLSISRSLFFGVGASVVFAIIAMVRKPKLIGTLMGSLLGIAIAAIFISRLEYFQTATEVFTIRFETANESEGGLEGVIIDRYLGGLIGALTKTDNLPFFGYGLGLGTNVGSMLVKGEVLYLIAEGEWGRLVGEMGLLLGVIVILLRTGLCVKIGVACYLKVTRGDILPWLLLSYGILIIPQGQWGQPTSLGFSTLVGGLMLASLRIPVSLKSVKSERISNNNAS